MVTKIQGIIGFSRTIGTAKKRIQITSLQQTPTFLATTPISTYSIKRQ